MDNEALLRRVERVERENRVWKVAGLLLLVVLVGMGAVQTDNKGLASDSLVTHKLVISDEQGNARAMITAEKDSAVLHFQTSTFAALKLGLIGEEPHLDTVDMTAKSGWRNWLGKPGAMLVPVR
jgi:hypothetical protein